MMPARGTILVVDDNPMVREVVQGMLNSFGFHALSVEDGATALAVFAVEEFDGAIVDVDMPGMNGVEVCRALQVQSSALGRPLLVWLMTGLVRPELPAAARQAGAVGVLPKPFTKAELRSCFENLEIHQDSVSRR